MSFDKAIPFILDHEGGTLTNDPVDRGGMTKWGISRAAFPDEDVPNMTAERAAKLIQGQHWMQIQGFLYPWPLDLTMLDFAFNSGSLTAVKKLQTAIGVKPDGIIGEVTRKALGSALTRLGPVEVARKLTMERRQYLMRIVARDPEQNRFLPGWMQRCIDLGFYIAKEG